MTESPSESLAPGQTVEVEIHALAAGGDGIGRLPDGRTVFVPFTAPGDRARVRVAELRARFGRAELVEVLTPGPGRTEPRCEVFGTCGGCQWQHLQYPTQCEAKRQNVEDALRRIGRLALPGPLEIVPSPVPYAYRERARMVVRNGEVGFRRARSHEICGVRACPVLAKDVEARLEALADDASVRDGEWELSAAGAHRMGDRRPPPHEIEVGGDRLRVSPGAFFQVHAGLYPALHRAALDAAGRGERAIELYAGGGFFTLGLARAFERVVAVESDRAGVSDLRRNLARAELRGVQVVRERVEIVLRAKRLTAEKLDAVVLDPPRSGLPAECADAIAELGPERIVYVSCDPATLARDLAQLSARGYQLGEVRAFDLFPQTPHVEVIARLTRATLG